MTSSLTLIKPTKINLNLSTGETSVEYEVHVDNDEFSGFIAGGSTEVPLNALPEFTEIQEAVQAYLEGHTGLRPKKAEKTEEDSDSDFDL